MIFLSDLDRTLIFSYNRLSADNLCVERKNGKELSYMTHRSAELFLTVTKEAVFIPITTRSQEQYERITFPGGYAPEYAIIDNGANLLINGVPDSEWRKEFDEIYKKAENEINMCRELLEKEASVYFKIVTVDRSFLFTKCHDAAEIIKKMNGILNNTYTSFYRNGEKLYLIPNGISKARALNKIRERLPQDTLVAAGDSLFDEGMLRSADVAIIKNGELNDLKLNPRQISDDHDNPDFVLEQIIKIIFNTNNQLLKH